MADEKKEYTAADGRDILIIPPSAPLDTAEDEASDQRTYHTAVVAHARKPDELPVPERPEDHPGMGDVVNAVTVEKH